MAWYPSRRTILLVEDEQFVREVAAEVLRTAGFRVLVAAKSSDAAKIHDEEHGNIDLLFSDMKLPGETGSALAKRLRRTNPGLRVLLATGYGELMHGAGHECLAKPFSSAEMLQRVETVFSGSEELGSEVADSHFLEGSSAGMGQSFCV